MSSTGNCVDAPQSPNVSAAKSKRIANGVQTPTKRRRGSKPAAIATGRGFPGPCTPPSSGDFAQSMGSPGSTDSGWTHRLPSKEERRRNGRVAGRSLIQWNRPKMTEKLLLHLVYECQLRRIELPWDSVAHRLHPGSTGTSITQHMVRARRTLIAEGHLVPPTPPSARGPNSSPNGGNGRLNPEVRGLVRIADDSSDPLETREVLFSETLDDRAYNLPPVDMDYDDDASTIMTPGMEAGEEANYEDDDDDVFQPQPAKTSNTIPASPPSTNSPTNLITRYDGLGNVATESDLRQEVEIMKEQMTLMNETIQGLMIQHALLPIPHALSSTPQASAMFGDQSSFLSMGWP